MTQRAQRRGRAIAMTAAEVDEFLAAERTCRVATVSKDGRPHVAPLWFVWDGTSLWLSSVVRSQRWTDLMRDPRVAVVIDAGVEYMELRGVELSGEVVPVGDIPRAGRLAPAHPGEAGQLGLPQARHPVQVAEDAARPSRADGAAAGSGLTAVGSGR